MIADEPHSSLPLSTQLLMLSKEVKDSRSTRRIIAEDHDWSLAIVPLLKDLTIHHIAKNFKENPIINELDPKDKAKVLEKLDTSLPLELTAHFIDDEEFWKRCSYSRWEVCDIEVYGRSWKRLFFEKHLENMIENYVPAQSDMTQICSSFSFASKFIKKLNIKQLLPPVVYTEVSINDVSDAESDSHSVTLLDVDHFDFCELLPYLSHLEEFRVVYGVKDCGMNFEWNIFKFTERDCSRLGLFFKKCQSLKNIAIQESKVDDLKVRMLSRHLLDHSCLQILNLSHNHIGNRGARAVAKLINNRCPNLTKLNLYDNLIYGSGAKAIAFALKKNNKLQELDLRFNRIGDEGGEAIIYSLVENSSLQVLNLSSNDMSELTASIISHMMKYNTTLRELDVSGNMFGMDGGKQLYLGILDNSTLTKLDLHLTEVGVDNEFYIAEKLYTNNNKYSLFIDI